MHITCNFHVNALRQSQQIPLVCAGARSRRIYAETGSKQRNNAPIYCRLRHAHNARTLACTAAAHRAAQHKLGYHWFLPDGSCTTHSHGESSICLAHRIQYGVCKSKIQNFCNICWLFVCSLSRIVCMQRCAYAWFDLKIIISRFMCCEKLVCATENAITKSSNERVLL